jgi:glycine cleavage system aminomethyltransferase T
MGPKARNLLQECSPDDLTNEAFPFGTAREIEIGMGLARAHRISYVGELGWELYVSTDQAAHVFETLTEAGANHDLKLCGLHALDSCRIEKAFRHFGHDITDEDHVLEAGLGFAVRTQKPDFIGRDAVLRKREEGLARRMVQFQLTDPEPMLFHNEALVRDGDRLHRDLRQLRPRTRRGHRHGLRPLPRRDRRRRSGFHLRDRSGRCAPRGEGQPRAALRSEI